jgi:hypothetical protein
MVNHRYNGRKGSDGEQLVRSLFYPYSKFFKHDVTSGGCDLVGFTLDKREVAIEVLNWNQNLNFVILADRWNNLITNLTGYPADIRILFCLGVKPTNAQSREARNLGISILHYPEQLEPSYDMVTVNRIKQKLTPQIEKILYTTKESNDLVKRILKNPNSISKPINKN